MGTDLYMDAFWDLSSTRQFATGVIGPIGWQNVFEYSQGNKFDETQTEDLIYYIGVLDCVYLEHKKREAERGN